jgi:hypothetical protein
VRRDIGTQEVLINALELDRPTSFNVVTDWLHFDGALVHLLELKRAGLDVRIVGAGLAASLAYVKEVGVANIQAYRRTPAMRTE